MADLVVLVPSRERPEAARELIDVFAQTCTANTFLAFVVDEDDPTRDQYLTAVLGARRTGVIVTPSHTMVEALNIAAIGYAQEGMTFAIGFMGDDHRPRTHGWDRMYLDALRSMGTGIVYGDDLFMGEKLPTQCAMTADIVRTLGYIAPPAQRHMFIDDFWRDLGRGADCLAYRPNVIIEHMHPAIGKSDWDEGYDRVNAGKVYAGDESAYRAYLAGEMPAAVNAVRALRNLPSVAPGEHEWRLFDEGTVPEYTTPGWYAEREHAPHLEQGGHRERLLATASFVAQAAFSQKCETVSDLGAGDGGLLSLLGPSLRGWGYDLMHANIAAAKKRGADVRLGDVVEGDVEYGEIVVCTEILEHLVDPHGFLRDLPDGVSALVCSSPKDETVGAAYEYHTWAWDLEGYRELVRQAGFRVIRQRQVNRFQVILAVRP